MPDLIRNAPPKPSRTERLQTRAKDARGKTSKRREVYALVNRRDKFRCRACGHPCDPSSTDQLQRGHHHHLRYRSQGGQDETSNLVLICALCHAAVHDRGLGITGNADSTLTLYGVTRGKDGHWESAP